MKYIRQLDSIRAVGALLVVIWHWVPQESILFLYPMGSFAVNCFFVLSGFLITSILLNNRKEAETQSFPKNTVLLNFYVRRGLRIFPIYFLLILLMALIHHRLHFSLNDLIASITYTTNFYFFAIKDWPLVIPHFWSLAVEEQFYLVWPLLMLFLPKRYLLHCIGLFILIGFISQTYITDREFGYLLPNACIDAFALGGFLAWVAAYKPATLPKFYRLICVLALISVGIIALDVIDPFSIKQIRTAHSILCVWVIAHILMYSEKKSWLVSFTNNKLLMTIGKVSYGIYLYHVLYYELVFYPMRDHLPFFKDLDPFYQGWLFLVPNLFGLYFICWLSWKYIERPILGLRHQFSYQKPIENLKEPPITISQPEKLSRLTIIQQFSNKFKKAIPKTGSIDQ